MVEAGRSSAKSLASGFNLVYEVLNTGYKTVKVQNKFPALGCQDRLLPGGLNSTLNGAKCWVNGECGGSRRYDQISE
jgi:hypothetical protein